MHQRPISRTNSFQNSFPQAYANSSIPVPSLPLELQKDQELHKIYETDFFPPLSTTNCIVNEKNNSSPFFMRSSMYTIPADSYTFDKINLPLFLSITPFSHKQEIQDNTLILSCSECQTFVNPFTEYLQGEGSFVCNICKFKNPCFEFPMTFSSCEYSIKENTISKMPEMVDDFYFKKCVFPNCFIFVIERNSLFLSNLRELKNLVENEAFQEQYNRIGIITVGENINIYGINIHSDDTEESIIYKKEIVETVVYSQLPFISPEYLFECKDALLIFDHLQNSKVTTFEYDINNILKLCLLNTYYAKGTKLFIILQKNLFYLKI